MADNLLNAMVNPIFICTIGGMAALGVRAVQAQPRGFAAQPARAMNQFGGNATEWRWRWRWRTPP
jgi:hypothetical protein